MRLVIAMNTASSSIWRWPAVATERLRRSLPGVEVVEFAGSIDRPPAPGEAAVFADADAAVAWRLDPALWRDARQLRWIHCPAASVQPLLTPELVTSGIWVSNGAAVHAATVAEHALALMLALARAIPQAVGDQAQRRWAAEAMTAAMDELAGSRAVILGMGHIYRELEPRLRALGVRVAGVHRANFDQLNELLAEADSVVLALPDTPATAGIFGAPQVAAVKRGARIINVGRGTAMDQAALRAGLESGQLGGAALDVFEREPLPPDSPLWHCPRLLITPHVAAANPRTWLRQADHIVARWDRFAAGEVPGELVDKRRGY